MRTNKTLITIITSTFNAGKTLQRCLDSVKSQDYYNIEHIIIDGNSTDDTVSIIKKDYFSPTSKIKYWKSEPDSGIYDAWNKALQKVQGDWVLFLGADDFLFSTDVISKSVILLEKLKTDTIKLVYGRAKREDESDFILGKWEDVKDLYRKGYSIFPHAATFHHSSLFKIYGNFDETYKIGGDTEYLYRYIMENDAKFINQYITCFSIGGVSTSAVLKRKKVEETFRIRNKYKQKITFKLKVQMFIWKYLSPSLADKLTMILSNVSNFYKIKN